MNGLFSFRRRRWLCLCFLVLCISLTWLYLTVWGNGRITAESYAQIKTKMTKAEVNELLGRSNGSAFFRPSWLTEKWRQWKEWGGGFKVTCVAWGPDGRDWTQTDLNGSGKRHQECWQSLSVNAFTCITVFFDEENRVVGARCAEGR